MLAGQPGACANAARCLRVPALLACTAPHFAPRTHTHISHAIHCAQELWQAAGSQGLLDPPGVPASALKRRLLFKPAALLGQEIEGIERALMGGQAEAGSKLRALEPGCGSARNLIALAVRERPGLSWHVLGADSS